MKVETAEWVTKAEADFVSANRELRARHCPNHDAACFHAQQRGEKKARLVEADIVFPRTHSLTALLHLLLPEEEGLVVLKPAAAHLTAFGVEFRYPGKTADKALARDAVNYAREVRRLIRRSLGLPEVPDSDKQQP